MGLMFAKRRIEEAAKRAANKAKAQAERQKEARAKHAAAKDKGDSGDVASKDGKTNGADTKGTK